MVRVLLDARGRPGRGGRGRVGEASALGGEDGAAEVLSDVGLVYADRLERCRFPRFHGDHRSPCQGRGEAGEVAGQEFDESQSIDGHPTRTTEGLASFLTARIM